MAGAALLEASSTFRATYSKWPNDILIERGSDQFGKLAGILVEATSSDGVMTGLVVGVGFNVCTPVHGFPDFLPWASSLEWMGLLLLTPSPKRSPMP